MKKSLAILTLTASVLLPTGTAFAADSSSPTAVPDAAPRMLELINRERAAAGLARLTLDQEATGIALSWSREMARAGRLSHNKAYLSPESMERLNATTVGENVAFADSVDRIHSLLMDSPPHRANILNADFRQVGVGAVRSSAGELYLTENFLTRRAQAGTGEEGPSGDEHAAPARSPKPSAPRRARPARPAASRPPVAKASRPPVAKASRPAAGSRPAAAKPSRPAAAAPARATKPPAPPTPTVAPASAAPPPAPSPEPVPPAEPAAPSDPVEPTASPQAPSEVQAAPQGPEPDAVPAEVPMFEEAAHQRGTGNSTGELVKGLPALVLFRRWLGRRR